MCPTLNQEIMIKTNVQDAVSLIPIQLMIKNKHYFIKQFTNFIFNFFIPIFLLSISIVSTIDNFN